MDCKSPDRADGRVFKRGWAGSRELPTDGLRPQQFEDGTTDNFEFDGAKRLENIRKHGVDFQDIPSVWHLRTEFQSSDRGEESRWIALTELDGVVIGIIYTVRGDAIRIISARKARDYERRAYRDLSGQAE
jgi:uncharacterized DUF497 family protein